MKAAIQHNILNAIVRFEKLLGLTVVTKSRTGFLIAVAAVVTIVGDVAVTNIGLLRRNDTYIFVGLGMLGFLAWLKGRSSGARRVEPDPGQDTVDGMAQAERSPAFLGNLKYWGIILVLSASALSCLAIWRQHKPAIVAQARPLPVEITTVTNVVTITNEAPRVSFPALELQGVVVNGAKSSAMINGRVLCLGEGVSNAVLVAVDSGHASMALEGQTNVLALRR